MYNFTFLDHSHPQDAVAKLSCAERARLEDDRRSHPVRELELLRILQIAGAANQQAAFQPPPHQ